MTGTVHRPLELAVLVPVPHSIELLTERDDPLEDFGKFFWYAAVFLRILEDWDKTGCRYIDSILGEERVLPLSRLSWYTP